MISLWDQDRITISIVLTIVIIGIILLLVNSGKIVKTTNSYLENNSIQRIFTTALTLLGIAGIVTMVVTVLPGLMPFPKESNTGLGGLVLFILWPIVIVQIIIGFIVVKSIREAPTFGAWMLLIMGYVIFLNVDWAAIDAIYR